MNFLLKAKVPGLKALTLWDVNLEHMHLACGEAGVLLTGQ